MVLESTGVGTWEYDHRREVIIRSQALNNVMRFSPDDAYEKLDSMLLRVHPDERAQVEEAFRHLLAGSSQGFSIDFRAQGGDGRMRWVSTRGQVVLRDDDGGPLRSAGVAIDIDQQKEAELALKKSDARFLGLIEQISLPVAYINNERQVLFVNEQFVDTFGYTQKDLPSVDVWNELVYPDPEYRAWARETWLEAAHQASESGRLIQPPIRYWHQKKRHCKNSNSLRLFALSSLNRHRSCEE
jgi:PAS domain S-box-containing protein